MTINRSNYEIWLIDFLDGNLNDLQKAELLLFLDENPDLIEELEIVSSVKLGQTDTFFPQKDLLKRSVTDTDDKNFELLCISYLEHDITGEQEEELLEILKADPGRRKHFDILQKIKLTPPPVTYNKKGRLKRSVFPSAKVYISIAGIAASLLILVSLFILPEVKKEPLVAEAHTDTLSVPEFPPVFFPVPGDHVKPGSGRSHGKILPVKISSAAAAQNIDSVKTAMAPINVPAARIKIDMNHGQAELIAFSPEQTQPVNDEERSRIGRFLAKTYRDIFLKDEKPSDVPLKGYEIAEGGINGLNKLLGWNMAITKNTDRNGELRSVYFSSKLLKFNSPVKNQSQQ